MHNGYWSDGSNNGSWWLMAIMMVAFWAAIIWLIVTLIRHGSGSHSPQTSPPTSPPAPAIRMTPQEVLADRLARGEIEPDDYRRRLDVLNQRSNE